MAKAKRNGVLTIAFGAALSVIGVGIVGVSGYAIAQANAVAEQLNDHKEKPAHTASLVAQAAADKLAKERHEATLRSIEALGKKLDELTTSVQALRP